MCARNRREREAHREKDISYVDRKNTSLRVASPGYWSWNGNSSRQLYMLEKRRQSIATGFCDDDGKKLLLSIWWIDLIRMCLFAHTNAKQEITFILLYINLSNPKYDESATLQFAIVRLIPRTIWISPNSDGGERGGVGRQNNGVIRLFN